jgi:hypothetical protein
MLAMPHFPQHIDMALDSNCYVILNQDICSNIKVTTYESKFNQIRSRLSNNDQEINEEEEKRKDSLSNFDVLQNSEHINTCPDLFSFLLDTENLSEPKLARIFKELMMKLID